jgi:uncharacterized repeat protein (TIGR01451 family)
MNCTLSGNTAQGGGSSVSKEESGSGLGGALFNLDGNATLTNVTIANNNAIADTGGGTPSNADGGGVYNLAYGNTITSGGANTATLTLNNTIIGQDSGGSELVNDAENGKNTNTAQVTGTNSLVQGGIAEAGNGNKINSNPTIYVNAPNLATTLANNGGLTPTLALLPGSPAIDTGDSSLSGLPTVDQRGYARIVGKAIDLGAVEYQYDLAVSGTAPASYLAGQTLAYSITVQNNGPDTAGNGGPVTLSDVLPAGVSFVSLAAPNGWTTANNNGTVTATIPTLASGASASFTLTVQTSNSTPNPLVNTVTVGPSTWDTNISNNSFVFRTTLATIAPTITSNPRGQTVTAGANVSFTASAGGSPVPTVQW